MTETAVSLSPSANTLDYYAESARFQVKDREFIIKNGLREWLLAVAAGRAAGISMPKPAVPVGNFDGIVNNVKNSRISSSHPGRHASELVILVANLIGGATNESN